MEKVLVARGLLVLIVTLLGVGRAFTQPSFDEAMMLYQCGQYERARSAFLEFAVAGKGDSQVPAARFYAIKCLYVQQDYNQFDIETEALRTEDPSHPALDDLTYLQACRWEGEGDWEQARARLDYFLSAFPESPYCAQARKRLAACKPRAPRPDFCASPHTLAFSSQATSETLGMTTEQEGQVIAWLKSLHEAGLHEKYLSESRNYLEKQDTHPQAPDLLFLQMKSFRAQKKWEEARAVANEIVQRYPSSAVASRMGGAEGRTEDQAAFAFAELVRDYHERRFTECISKCEAFLQQHPQNWRLEELCRFYCYAMYHGGDTRFFDLSRELLQSAIDPNQMDQILFLQAALLVRQGLYPESRAILNSLIEYYPDSSFHANFYELRFLSFYREGDYASLAEESRKALRYYPALSREWGYAIVFRGIALSLLGPANWAEAKSALDTMLASPFKDSKLNNPEDHYPTLAAFWRCWIAMQENDGNTVCQWVGHVRSQSPEGATKKAFLEQYASWCP